MCSSEKAQGFHWTLRAAASLQSITIEDGSSVWQTSQQFTNRAFRGYVHGNLHNEDCIFNRFRWLRRQLRLHRLRPLFNNGAAKRWACREVLDTRTKLLRQYLLQTFPSTSGLNRRPACKLQFRVQPAPQRIDEGRISRLQS